MLDRKTGKVIKKVPLSGHPNNISVTKNGDRIVVAIARGKGGLDIVDAATLTLKKTISERRAPAQRLRHAGQQIRGRRLDPGEDVLRLRPRQRGARLGSDGRGVRCMAIETNPDGSTKRVFTQLSAFNGFSVVDFAEQKEVTKVPLPEPPFEYDHGGYRTNGRLTARHYAGQ